MLPEISFIIPSYNSYKTIYRTVRSILDQTVQENIKEIIVVDSSGDDFTRKVLKTIESPILKVICLEQKTFPSLGRNIGAKQAIGRVLCFIDSDIELCLDWVELVTKEIQKGCLIGGGAILLTEDQKYKILPLAQYCLQFNEFVSTREKRSVSLLPSCNFFCDRELFFQIGGFPNLRASEDVMFCLKAKEITPIFFLPDAKCWHIFREDWNIFLKNQEMLGRYIIIYRRMYYHSWFYQGLWPVFFLPVFLFIKLFRILSRIFRAGPEHIRNLLFSLPVFMIGLLFWGWGFLLGCFKKDIS